VEAVVGILNRRPITEALREWWLEGREAQRIKTIKLRYVTRDFNLDGSQKRHRKREMLQDRFTLFSNRALHVCGNFKVFPHVTRDSEGKCFHGKIIRLVSIIQTIYVPALTTVSTPNDMRVMWSVNTKNSAVFPENRSIRSALNTTGKPVHYYGIR
jgi:hypothetical protein